MKQLTENSNYFLNWIGFLLSPLSLTKLDLSILLGQYENKKHLMPPIFILFYYGRHVAIHVYSMWLSADVFTILHNMLGYWVLKLRFWLHDWENWTRLSWQPSPSGILLAAWRPYWHRLWLSFLFFHLHIVKKIKYWKFYLKFWHSSK